MEACWSFKATEAGEQVVLPDGRCDLIIRYNMNHDSGFMPIVTGPATRPYTVSFVEGDSWVGIRLRPDFGRLLWKSKIVDAADNAARGDEALLLIPELAQFDNKSTPETFLASVIANRVAHFSNLLQDKYTLPALNMIHVSGGRLGLNQLAMHAGCSPRHLNRLFKTSVGLQVKTYAQLVQFHRTLAFVQNEQMPITAASFEGGYSDHAHLTRSFRRFGGIVPSKIPNALTLPRLFG
jgi:AraC-like DNA-binding protein